MTDAWLNKIVSTIQNFAKMQYEMAHKKVYRKAKTPYFMLKNGVLSSMWALRDSNPGPIDYESTALTSWAKGPILLKTM